MSSVTMCDFCGVTTRAAGDERAYDLCGGCQEGLAVVLSEFQARRFGGANSEAS
jgi:hypothetical protein